MGRDPPRCFHLPHHRRLSSGKSREKTRSYLWTNEILHTPIGTISRGRTVRLLIPNSYACSAPFLLLNSDPEKPVYSGRPQARHPRRPVLSRPFSGLASRPSPKTTEYPCVRNKNGFSFGTEPRNLSGFTTATTPVSLIVLYYVLSYGRSVSTTFMRSCVR